MGIKIRIENETDFSIVQNRVFDLGGLWSDYTTNLFPFRKAIDGIYGVVFEFDENTGKNLLSYFEEKSDFDEDPSKEISVDEFLDGDDCDIIQDVMNENI